MTTRLPLIASTGLMLVLLCGCAATDTSGITTSSNSVSDTVALSGRNRKGTCVSTLTMVIPTAQTYLDIAKQLCGGDSTSNIVDQIIELNPNLDPLNLQFGDIVNLPFHTLQP